MTITSEIQRINTNIGNAYTAISNKGGTLPNTQNSANLATAINSISTGSGSATLTTKTITSNGTYNASSDNADGYSSVTVNVSGGIGITREVSSGGVYQMPTSSFTFSLPSNATDLGRHALRYAFYNCSSITSADLSSLTTISGENALSYTFSNCANLTSVDLSGLTEGKLNGTFSNCTNLTSVDLSSLTHISGNSMQSTFADCSNLETISFPNLITIGDDVSPNQSSSSHLSSCFNNCSKLKTLTFPKLEKIYCNFSSASAGTFAGNNKIEKLYFPKLDTITYATGASSSMQTAAKNIFYGCSALTEIHFGSANQTAIENSAGYSTLWGRGAGNATVYFDL